MKSKYLVTFTAAFGIAAAVSLPAQAGGQSDRPNATTGTITLTGCLQRADTVKNASGAVGTSGTRGADAFVLVPDSSGTLSRSSRSATGHAAEDRGPWYAVEGNSDDLRTRADHRVEVTGTLDTAGSVVGTSASATDGPSGTIHASSIKVINASCHQLGGAER